MVNPKLVNWIKSEEAQGYSEKALIKVLSKQNYSNKDIKEAFDSLKEKSNKTPFSISFILLTGLSFISLILITITLLISFTTGMIIGYLLMILSGTGIGYLIYHIKNKLTATERFGAIMGIFSPGFSLIMIIISLKILQKLSAQLSKFAAQGESVGGFPDLVTIFTPSMNPVIAAVLFYLGCNVFVIISIIKSKEYKTFLWYLFAPTLFFVLWLIIDLFTSSVMKSTLG
jgi:hypothetical protein